MEPGRDTTAVEPRGVGPPPRGSMSPMELDLGGEVAPMFGTVTTIATPHDVRFQDLHVEVFHTST